jgi:hypothetical protein
MEDRRQRLQVYLERLSDAPRASTGAEARQQSDSILNEVETELTNIPNDPTTLGSDGRNYPPQDDRCHRMPNHPDVFRCETRGHYVFYRDNGAIRIETRSLKRPAVLFDKPGSDGRGVFDDNHNDNNDNEPQS